MAATPPTGTTTPARPGTAPEPVQLELFDARPYWAAVADILGSDAATWSRDHTLAESAVVGAATGGHYRAARIVTVVLLAMGGRGYCDLTGDQIAAAVGPTVTRQHVQQALRGLHVKGRTPKLGAIEQGLLEVAERRGRGRGRRRVLVRGIVLRELPRLVAARGYKNGSLVAARGYNPIERESSTTTTEPLDHDEDAATFVVPGAECERCGQPVTSNPKTGEPNPLCRDCNERDKVRRRQERRARAEAAEAPRVDPEAHRRPPPPEVLRLYRPEDIPDFFDIEEDTP